MGNLTKAQINYFSDRLDIIVRWLTKSVSEELCNNAPKRLSMPDKVEMLASGKVKFNYEKAVNCAVIGKLMTIDDLFTFPGECEAANSHDHYLNAVNAFLPTIKEDKMRIVDRFVLGDIDDPKVAIEKFEERTEYYIELFKTNYKGI